MGGVRKSDGAGRELASYKSTGEPGFEKALNDFLSGGRKRTMSAEQEEAARNKKYKASQAASMRSVQKKYGVSHEQVQQAAKKAGYKFLRNKFCKVKDGIVTDQKSYAYFAKKC